jgi:hypothetical protein
VSEADLQFLRDRFKHWRSQKCAQVNELWQELPSDDPLFCPISLFRTMDSGRLERAHTNTLAWLLDPRKEHGFGAALTEALLSWVAGADSRRMKVDKIRSEHPIEMPEEGGRGRIDVLATGGWLDGANETHGWVLALEAKIDAGEQDGQLAIYDQWLNSQYPNDTKLRVFLTSDGRAAETSANDWAPLSFLKLVCLFRRAVGGLKEKPGYHFVRFYLSGVLQDICGWSIPIRKDQGDPYAVADYLAAVHESLGKEDASESTW